MCKLLNAFILPTAPPDARREVAEIIKAQKAILKGETDGVAVMAWQKTETKPIVKRSIMTSQYDKFIALGIKEAKKNETQGVILHTRTKTTGLKHKDNTHLFNREGWYFAHNGWISKLSSFYSYPNYSSGWTSGYKQPSYIGNSQTSLYDPPSYHFKDGILQRGEGDDYLPTTLPVTGFEAPNNWISNNKYKKACNAYMRLNAILEACAECFKVMPDYECINHKRAYGKFLEFEATIEQYAKQDNYAMPETAIKPLSVLPVEINKKIEPDKTDSQLFLEAIDLKKLSKKYLKAKMTELAFSGVATLINPVLGIAYFLASREIDIFTDLKNYLAIASYSMATPRHEQNKKIAFGLSFDVPSNRVFTLSEGVYKLNLNDLKFNS